MDDIQKRLFIFIYCNTETLCLVKICCRIFDRLSVTIFLSKAFNMSGFDQHYLKYSHDQNFRADVHVL